MGRVHVRAWQEGYKNGLMPDDFLEALSVDERERMWADTLARVIRPRFARFASIDDDGTLAGFIAAGPMEGSDGSPIGEVYSLNVDPDYWGRGHGGALLAAGAEALRQAGFAEAVLWVHRGARRSRQFYEHHGWQPDGTERTIDVMDVEVPETRYHRLLTEP
jgi:GNAT superfamily N-acetyltransferase